ncbi:glycine-rich domain-containing protein [Streptomyces chartreusis]|uniref:glycine-rich domain-containing protein n=1 Tax=Streptomyces chartreusis TaxID=1969 RepID=UPI00386DA416|nr:hypothetical protein OG938_19835 [Streptomyces chartreusis]WTA29144.1 hypothetical protein OIA45_25390 [Streptomyces chartreusis]
MTIIDSEVRTGRSLLSAELFDSLTNFITIHDGATPDQAERIADQAAAFLATVAVATVPMVPSDDVDMGLHAFILHTKEYASFCETHAGRFLHHNPAPGAGCRQLEDVQAAAHAMKAAGFHVFDELWTVNGENAAQCDSDCGRPYGE